MEINQAIAAHTAPLDKIEKDFAAFEGIVELAKQLKRDLQPSMRTVYDDTGGIGKLYARQDEVGTPFCVTIDHESLEDNAVTIRDRDTWEQERVSVDTLKEYLQKRLGGV